MFHVSNKNHSIIFYLTSVSNVFVYDILQQLVTTSRINSDKKVVELEINSGTIIWYSHLYSDVHNPCGL